MHLNKYLLYFFLLLSVNLIVSCDDDDDDATPNRTELLTTGEWRGDRILLNNINAASIPGIGSNAESFETLVLDFNEDNTYTANFTVNGQAESFDGTWEFNTDQTSITLDTFGELDIERLTEDNLDVSTSLDTTELAVIAEILGVDPTLIQFFTGGNAVDTEMRFVR